MNSRRTDGAGCLLVARFGGVHHGYYLPSEGANNVAMPLFSFPSLARYEEYRAASATDPDCNRGQEIRA